jgi:hypothetical protein
MAGFFLAGRRGDAFNLQLVFDPAREEVDSRRQAQLCDLCREMLPAAPFVVSARAWAARGLA